MKSLFKILRIILVSLCLGAFSACSIGPVVLEKDINVQVTQDLKKISSPIYFSKKFKTKPRQWLIYSNNKLMGFSGNWLDEMDGRIALDKSLTSVVNSIFEKPNVASCADANYCVELNNIYETKVSSHATGDIHIQKFSYNTTIDVKDNAGKSILVREVIGESTSAEFDQEVDEKYLIELAITRMCQKVSNALLGINWN
jgi:hypothetical protein